MANSKTAKNNDNTGDIGWQAQKSAMTRDRILQAAVESFVTKGFSNVTTAMVANTAGVSRGAMLHHFPSRTELMQAAVEYLHDRIVEDFSQRIGKIPAELQGAARRRAGLDAYWEHLTGDLFTAYHELCVAGRTDPELRDILDSSQAAFEAHVQASNAELFEEWNDRGDRFLLAMDLTKFLMEGMALGQMKADREHRRERLLGYLTDRLEEIFNASDGEGAIDRHTR